MSEISFKCPHCQQDLTAPDEMAGQTIDCPACNKPFEVPGGIEEMPASAYTPPPTMSATGDADKGKTVRIELPPDFLQEPEKHIFKIKRIQR